MNDTEPGGKPQTISTGITGLDYTIWSDYARSRWLKCSSHRACGVDREECEVARASRTMMNREVARN